MKRTVLLYETEDKKSYVKDFLLSLDDKIRNEIIKIIKLLQDVDVLSEPYFKKLTNTDGIWEIRKKFGSNSYRIFFFFDENIAILTHGLLKKTTKTPKQDIIKAEKIKNNYLMRKK